MTFFFGIQDFLFLPFHRGFEVLKILRGGELLCEKYKAYGKEKVPNFVVRDYLSVRCEDGFKC